jgi:hypothetical protein
MSGGQPLCGACREKAIEIWTRGMEFWPFVIRIISINISFPSASSPKSITPMLAILELHREEEEEEAPYLRNRYSKYSCPIKTAVHLFHLRGIIASSLLVVETKRKATTRKQRARCQRSPAFQSAHFSNFEDDDSLVSPILSTSKRRF